MSIATCLLGVAPLNSQEPPEVIQAKTVSIPGEPVPGQFSILRFKVATISDEDYEGGAFIDPPLVHVTRDTTFFVTAGGSDLNELYFAARTGELVQRIGRDGEGPGEYRSPWFVGETESEYHVIDVGLHRKTTLRKEDFEVVRSVRLPGVDSRMPPVFFPDGSLAVLAYLFTREHAGLPCHLISTGGEITESFGPRYSSPRERVLIGGMAASGDSAVWVAHLDRYRLELWSRGGILLERYDRAAPWFRSRDDISERDGERYTQIDDLYEDEGGRLWVHASERIRAGAGRIRSDPGAFASIIEVLDPDNARVLATLREAGVREYSTSGFGFFQQVMRYSADDLLLVDVWANQLVSGH